mgnify:CR=1 FL=1
MTPDPFPYLCRQLDRIRAKYLPLIQASPGSGWRITLSVRPSGKIGPWNVTEQCDASLDDREGQLRRDS